MYMCTYRCNVSPYVYVYEYVSVYVYVYVHVYSYVRMHVYLYVYVRVYSHVDVYAKLPFTRSYFNSKKKSEEEVKWY